MPVTKRPITKDMFRGDVLQRDYCARYEPTTNTYTFDFIQSTPELEEALKKVEFLRVSSKNIADVEQAIADYIRGLSTGSRSKANNNALSTANSAASEANNENTLSVANSAASEANNENAVSTGNSAASQENNENAESTANSAASEANNQNAQSTGVSAASEASSPAQTVSTNSAIATPVLASSSAKEPLLASSSARKPANTGAGTGLGTVKGGKRKTRKAPRKH